VFSTGSEDLNDDDDEVDVGEKAQDRVDIEHQTGTIDATLDLEFRGSLFNGAGSPNALNSFEAVLSITIEHIGDIDGDADARAAIAFVIDEFTATFSPIRGAPLTFQFGTDVAAEFTDYVLETEDPGFVATLGGVGFLDFLDPTVT